jgi:hypothetical protein
LQIFYSTQKWTVGLKKKLKGFGIFKAFRRTRWMVNLQGSYWPRTRSRKTGRRSAFGDCRQFGIESRTPNIPCKTRVRTGMKTGLRPGRASSLHKRRTRDGSKWTLRDISTRWSSPYVLWWGYALQETGTVVGFLGGEEARGGGAWARPGGLGTRWKEPGIRAMMPTRRPEFFLVPMTV